MRMDTKKNMITNTAIDPASAGFFLYRRRALADGYAALFREIKNAMQIMHDVAELSAIVVFDVVTVETPHTPVLVEPRFGNSVFRVDGFYLHRPRP